MEQRFAGQTVIVTGASGNIGEGIIRRFAAEGANVVVTGRDKGKLETLAGTLDPDRTAVLPADVTREADVRALADAAAARFGGIDVLVSNAGVGYLSPFEDLTIEDWRRVIDTNLTGCFLGAQACLPHLKRAKGSIIQIASASGLGGDAGMSAYNASKGAVVNLTRGLAFDLGPYGVRVNAVTPSITYPEGISHPMLANADFLDRFQDRRALEGHATPDDIAGAVAFLASADARFITGAILPVDGGITAGSGQPRFR
jgi:meso-butanediol dehydrogenase/(S,S)-butanediol dehydrogenase/diacetyl reductase